MTEASPEQKIYDASDNEATVQLSDTREHNEEENCTHSGAFRSR